MALGSRIGRQYGQAKELQELTLRRMDAYSYIVYYSILAYKPTDI